MTPFATYYYLLVHEGKLLIRSFVWRRHWMAMILLSLLGLYFAFALVSMGFLWREMVAMIQPGVHPVAFLNRHLITIFIGLFTLRFFMQRTPQMQIRPYLHLPVARNRLVRFFQVSSLATIHNAFPFLFVLPLWWRHIYTGPYPALAKWGWLVGVVLVLLLSHYLNTLLRALLRRSREGFFIVFGVFLLVLLVDLLLGPGALNTISAFIFDTLVAERPLILLLLAMLVGVVFRSSSLALRQNLVVEDRSDDEGRIVLWQVPFRPSYHWMWNLLLLELKLMWRSERPKLYFLMSVVVAIISLAVPFINADFAGGPVAQSVAGLFASGIFAFNYGQLMFAWESSYFDGLLVRPIALRDVVLAKVLLLQGSCLVFYLFSLPVFLVLAPGLVVLHTAFLCYNAGLSTMLVMMLAVNNRQGVRLTNVGFFNFEGFSLLHWLWYIPMIIPPALVLYLSRDAPTLGPLLIGGIGAVSLLLERQWVIWLTRHLARSRYEMAAGFRKTT